MWETVGVLGSAAFSAAALILVAIINRGRKKDEKITEQRRVEEDKRASQREKEALLSMRMSAANCELSDVIAIAVTGGHTNGNVEAARNKAREAKEEYENFLLEVSSEILSK